MPSISAEQLIVGYGRTPLLPAFDLRAQPGEIWAIAGPNGSGKTTLLRTLLGLLPAVAGRVERPNRVGYVPQRTALGTRIPGRVIDIVRAGLDEGWSFVSPTFRSNRRAEVERVLEITRVGDLRAQRFDELSEGQKQRVLIARAMVRRPELLVLDEPTSAMDIASEHRVMHLLDEIREREETSILLVSHHLAVVAEFATHLVVVDRDLRSVVVGPIDIAGADSTVMHRYGRIFVDAERHTDSHFAVEESDA